jgi:hypothetical protein
MKDYKFKCLDCGRQATLSGDGTRYAVGNRQGWVKTGGGWLCPDCAPAGRQAQPAAATAGANGQDGAGSSGHGATLALVSPQAFLEGRAVASAVAPPGDRKKRKGGKQPHPELVHPGLLRKAMERAKDRRSAFSEYVRLHYRASGNLAPGCDARDFFAAYDALYAAEGVILIFDRDGVRRLWEHAKSCQLHWPAENQVTVADYLKPGEALPECGVAGADQIDQGKVPAGLVLVHDQGVYLMSNGLPELPQGQNVVYAEGLGPRDDSPFCSIVGGDDFGECLPAEMCDLLAQGGKRRLRVTSSSFEVVSLG